MGTRSVIGVMHGDKAKTVYCHWDGYLAHNGKILLGNYDSAKANNLVALGDLSSLSTEIGEKHPFDNPHRYDTPEYKEFKEKYGHMCTFYGRDRDEEGTDFKVCFSDKEMFETYEWCEYFYIMKDGVWYVSEGEGTEWKVLADAIAEEEAAEAEQASAKIATTPKLIGITQE